MRTIKFKAKRVDNGEWIFGDLIQWHDKKRAAITPPNGTMWMTPDDFEVIPETIGQFTGLLDKNGKEIYEGDRIKNGKDERDYHVHYSDQEASFCLYYNGSIVVYNMIGRSMEVIGNIHDTKED